MIILVDGIEYIMASPRDENSLEEAIKKNTQHIFGEEAFYFDFKTKIKSAAGIGSIPDAYVIVFTPQPQWCILEVELSSHPLYGHVIPQLTKFNRAIEESTGRNKIANMLYEAIKEDPILEAKLRKKIGSGEIYKFITELISSPPNIIIAIDEKTAELEEAIKDIRGNVHIIEFMTFRRKGMAEEIDAYLFNPIFNFKARDIYISKNHGISKSKGILAEGMRLKKTYKGKDFIAEVLSEQKIRFNGEIYNSVSMAAVAAIRSTGSKRATEDGWRWWTYIDPESGEQKLIDELRKG